MKLTALQPIRHDGKRYDAGDTLDVKSKSQADALVACGSAEPFDDAKARAEAQAKKLAIAEAEQAVAAATAALGEAATDEAKAAAKADLDKAVAALQAAKG